MSTEFNNALHYGFFMTGTTLTSATGKYVRQSELTLAALRAAGLLDRMVDGIVPPATDKLWLDKNSDPAVLKEWDSIGSAWAPMTFERMFERAAATVLAVTGGTANAITVSEPSVFISNRLYSISPTLANTGATTITITGVGTFQVKYLDGSSIVANEFAANRPSMLIFRNGRFELLFGYAAQVAAELAASRMPPAVEALSYIRGKADGTVYEARTPAQLIADISAQAPTWTGLHTFTATAGGWKVLGAPNLVGTYLGGSQKFATISDIIAANAAGPEGTAHFNMTSSLGYDGTSPSLSNNYKTALSAKAVSNPVSADVWAQSNVAELKASGVRRGAIGLELDLNNFWGDFTGAIAGPYAANLFLTGQNTDGSTGGYSQAAIVIQFAQNANPMWKTGISIGPTGFNPFLESAIHDESNSPISIQITGTHAIGVDMSSGTFTDKAIITPGFAVTGAGDVLVHSISAVVDKPASRTSLGFADGTYTPTLTNGANVAVSGAYVCNYMRVGDTVFVSGRVDIDPTAVLTETILGISLPIASALVSLDDLSGTIAANGSGLINSSGAVWANIAGDRAEARFYAQSLANLTYSFSFSYRVL